MHQVGISNYFMRKMHVQTTLKFLFCFCTVSLGWSRTNFHVLWPPKRLVTGNVRIHCFWTEIYDMWENTNYCRGSFHRKHNCLLTNLTAYHAKSHSIFANRVHPVSLSSAALSTTFLLELNFVASLSCCSFHALYVIYSPYNTHKCAISCIIYFTPNWLLHFILINVPCIFHYFSL